MAGNQNGSQEFLNLFHEFFGVFDGAFDVLLGCPAFVEVCVHGACGSSESADLSVACLPYEFVHVFPELPVA